MRSSDRKEKKFTTSKKILWCAMIFFIITVAIAIKFAYDGDKDTSIFMYLLPITGGIAGATIVFYLNKSKMENVFRFKIAFLEYKLDLIHKYPENADVIEQEMSSVDMALDSKIDSTMNEAVGEDISIQSY